MILYRESYLLRTLKTYSLVVDEYQVAKELDRAYPWYANLNRISLWVGEPCISIQHKFVSAEAKIKLAEVGWTCQYSGEDLDAYVKKFQEKALDYYNPVAEDVLVTCAVVV